MEVAKYSKDNTNKINDIRPEQEIIMTKWAGLEGTIIIAERLEDELLKRLTKDFINQAKGLKKYISVIKDSEIAYEMGTPSIYELNETGVFGGLWEIVKDSLVGFEVFIDKIPIKQETIEICEFYDLNPYELKSRGSLLIVSDKGNALVTKFKDNNINAAVIGKIKKGKDKVVINGDYKRYLMPPKKDELYKLNEVL